jgi:hypothetical protein
MGKNHHQQLVRTQEGVTNNSYSNIYFRLLLKSCFLERIPDSHQLIYPWTTLSWERLENLHHAAVPICRRLPDAQNSEAASELRHFVSTCNIFSSISVLQLIKPTSICCTGPHTTCFFATPWTSCNLDAGIPDTFQHKDKWQLHRYSVLLHTVILHWSIHLNEYSIFRTILQYVIGLLQWTPQHYIISSHLMWVSRLNCCCICSSGGASKLSHLATKVVVIIYLWTFLLSCKCTTQYLHLRYIIKNHSVQLYIWSWCQQKHAVAEYSDRPLARVLLQWSSNSSLIPSLL